MRGKGAGKYDAVCARRITPACAGKRGRRPSPAAGVWDHPRVCGEKASLRFHFSTISGSPPRVRGKAGGVRTIQRRPGITPACAGKSAPCAGDLPRRQDHPRVCGEKSVQLMLYAMSPGSPPRVRGKALAAHEPVPAPGITPARAGKRLTALQARLTRGDHPRACGEKHCDRRGTELAGGSPPRVRGKDLARREPGGHAGITPARAGKRA